MKVGCHIQLGLSAPRGQACLAHYREGRICKRDPREGGRASETASGCWPCIRLSNAGGPDPPLHEMPDGRETPLSSRLPARTAWRDAAALPPFRAAPRATQAGTAKTVGRERPRKKKNTKKKTDGHILRGVPTTTLPMVARPALARSTSYLVEWQHATQKSSKNASKLMNPSMCLTCLCFSGYVLGFRT